MGANEPMDQLGMLQYDLSLCLLSVNLQTNRTLHDRLIGPATTSWRGYGSDGVQTQSLIGAICQKSSRSWRYSMRGAPRYTHIHKISPRRLKCEPLRMKRPLHDDYDDTCLDIYRLAWVGSTFSFLFLLQALPRLLTFFVIHCAYVFFLHYLLLLSLACIAGFVCIARGRTGRLWVLDKAGRVWDWFWCFMFLELINEIHHPFSCLSGHWKSSN